MLNALCEIIAFFQFLPPYVIRRLSNPIKIHSRIVRLGLVTIVWHHLLRQVFFRGITSVHLYTKMRFQLSELTKDDILWIGNSIILYRCAGTPYGAF